MTTTETWDTLVAAGGRVAIEGFQSVWFKGGTLTSEQDTQLRELFGQIPLGQTNFKTWLKQTTRQVFDRVALDKSRK